jgi:hypothetical protein
MLFAKNRLPSQSNRKSCFYDFPESFRQKHGQQNVSRRDDDAWHQTHFCFLQTKTEKLN